MLYRLIKKISHHKLILTLIFVILFSLNAISHTYAIWGSTEKGGIYWLRPDATWPKGMWEVIDEDGDGYGFYYYFNENGFLQIDDILDDFTVVDNFGRKVDLNGDPILVKVDKVEDVAGGVQSQNLIEDLHKQILAGGGTIGGAQSAGFSSSGSALYANSDMEQTGPKPSDFIVFEDNTGAAKQILSGNAVIKKDKEEKYDTSISKKLVDYIVSGKNYSKKVNGTTFTKNKWKEVMSLKGNGASILFENPKGNFNKIKGRIATHYFTYSERTTMCTLNVIDDETNEELFQTNDFNYNAGISFEFSFYRSVKKIRFELSVDGQYTTRVCYLRNLEFGFDREMYQDELYQIEIENEYIAKYGTPSEADPFYNQDEEGEGEVDDNENSVEGEDPTARYNRINGAKNEFEELLKMDENDEELSAELRASISEAKRKAAEEAEKNNLISGPAFDQSLKDAAAGAIGPNGMSNVIKSEGQVSDD